MPTHVHRLDDGRDLAYVTAGPADGEPVLFFHGIPGSRLVPAKVDSVARRFGVRVISIDRPGFGLSDFQPGRTLLHWPEDVAALADSLGLDTFRVLGMSAGGPYALGCCVAIPERIEKAAVVGGLTPLDEGGIIREGAPRLLHWPVRNSLLFSKAMHGLLVLGIRRDRDRALEGLGRTLSPADRRVLEDPEFAQFIVDSTLEAARRGILGWAYDDRLLNRPWGFSPADVARDVSVELWYGGDDTAVPLSHAEAMAGEMPGANLRVHQGEGHMGFLFGRMDEILEDLIAA